MGRAQRFTGPLVLALACLAPFSAFARPIPDGLWEFDDSSNLVRATEGENLGLEGSHTSTAGTSGDDGAVLISQGSYYRCAHGFAANSGGARVNAYTVVMDLKIASSGVSRTLVQPNTANTGDGILLISPSGSLGSPETGYSTDVIYPNQWYRVAMVVDLRGTAGAIDLYVNGASWLHAEPSFWETVRGDEDIHEDGPFSLDPRDSSTPWVLLFADDDGDDGPIRVSSVALYDRALLAEEVKDLGGPERAFIIPNEPGATTVMYSEFLSLPSGHYETVLLSGVANVVGYLRLEDVVVDPPGTPSSIAEGFLGLSGTMLRVTDIVRTSGGYRASCLFKMPGFLGGMSEGVDVLIENNACAMEGVHFELPNIVKDGVEVKNVFLDIDTGAGKYGAGGLVKLPAWGQGIGGDIEIVDGLGAEVNGVRLPDVTKIDLQATGLDIPIGEVFSLYSLGGGIENEFGLSNPVNWGNSELHATMKIVVEPKFTIGGRAYFLYAFNAEGSFSIHDGSLNVDGTGLLMNTIETNTVHAHFDPPYYLDIGAGFNALDIFTGSFDAGVTSGGFYGDLHGTLGIPKAVPVVGGWTFADAKAHLDNTEFEGSLDIVLTPAIPSICTPQICFPSICISWWSCDSTCWAWIFPYPCNCNWHTACWTPPCIPPICTPAIPAVKLHFGFKYVATSGDFSWEKSGPYNAWEVPIEAPIKTGAQNGAFYVLTNWWTADSASTHPVRGTQKSVGIAKNGKAETPFNIGDNVPAALFRLNYENTGVTEVDMAVKTPGGQTLHSADGALPTGFSSLSGYSRFNADAQEQVIVLLEPAQGNYTVTVGNESALGNYTIDLVIEDQLPSGEITSITAGEEDGQYEIAWDDYDLEGPLLVRIFLDHDRTGTDGFLVATLRGSANTGSYTLDTSALNVHAGDYFVRLEVDDGVNAPYSFHSQDTISVVPTDAPEPVTNIQFLPDDGKFHISWDPSPTADLRGYLVLYKDAAEDLGHFNRRRFVPVEDPEEEDYGATIDGLLNDEALLVTVVAVDQEHHRSYPAEIVRIIPHAPGEDTVPHIVSTPNASATATYAYSYLPTMSDTNFGTYVWSLDSAPKGMTVDSNCGLVYWTPTADQEGANCVVLRLTKNQDPALSATQSFGIHVYPSHQVNGLEEHAYQVASAPTSNTTDSGNGSGEKCWMGTADANAPYQYQYQVLVHGPTEDLHFELAAGPDGMTIDEDTGLISWDVPAGAKGAWVRVEITAEDEHKLEQDFYLHVHRSDHFPSIAEDDASLFGCATAEASSGSGSSTEGFGEFVLLFGVITLACLVRRFMRRQRCWGKP